ncbi:MAG: response regulator transcription factor [Verrucomicrobiales bacterium]|nr:response regulator transcription factor [Verrucomicrobiales bacterium]
MNEPSQAQAAGTSSVHGHPGSPRLRVAAIEDDPEQLGFLVHLISHYPSLDCVGSFLSSETALPELASLRPDVVLVDIGLPGMSGTELVRHLKPLLPNTQFMMLTVIDDTPRIVAALEAGATGYLLKKDIQRRLADAIHELHEGGSPMSSGIARRVVQSIQHSTATKKAAAGPVSDADLTDRERQILDRLSAGMLYKEIAAELGVALGTVNTHIRHIYEKLHVHSRHQAMIRAKECGSA